MPRSLTVIKLFGQSSGSNTIYMTCLGPPSINCPSVGTWHSVPIPAEEIVMSVQLHTIKLPPTSVLSNSHSTCGCLVPDVKRCDNQGRKPFEQSELCRPGSSSGSGGLSLLVEFCPLPRHWGGLQLADPGRCFVV
jgi:hypothetical protein